MTIIKEKQSWRVLEEKKGLCIINRVINKEKDAAAAAEKEVEFRGNKSTDYNSNNDNNNK